MELNYVSKFKILLELTRWVPLVFALLQATNIFSQFLGYNPIILNNLSSISWLVLIYLYLISYALNFCFYHRLSLHYILITQLLCVVDQNYELPIDLLGLFILHILIFLVFITLLIYFKAAH